MTDMTVKISEKQKIEWGKDLHNLSDRFKDSEGVELLVEEISNIASKYLGSIDLITKELKIGRGYVVIRGCPIDDDLHELPSSTNRPKDKSYISEAVLLGVTHALGYNPFGFKQEKNGSLIHEITPLAGKEETSSSNGVIDFLLHADGAYLSRNVRPETLSLFCLIDEEKTDTRLVTIDSIMSKLNPDSVEILSNANFIHTPPATFEVSDENNSSGSIFDRVDGCWEMKVATHNCEPLTLAAKSSLEAFTNAAELNAVGHTWKQGDLLIFNNFRCLHGRGKINGKRWLQRCYGSTTVSVGEVIDLAA